VGSHLRPSKPSNLRLAASIKMGNTFSLGKVKLNPDQFDRVVSELPTIGIIAAVVVFTPFILYLVWTTFAYCGWCQPRNAFKDREKGAIPRYRRRYIERWNGWDHVITDESNQNAAS
jgi:hypothetical protein